MARLPEAWQPGDGAGARLVRIWESFGSPGLQSSTSLSLLVSTGTSRVCLAAGSDLARAFSRGSGPQKLFHPGQALNCHGLSFVFQPGEAEFRNVENPSIFLARGNYLQSIKYSNTNDFFFFFYYVDFDGLSHWEEAILVPCRGNFPV